MERQVKIFTPTFLRAFEVAIITTFNASLKLVVLILIGISSFRRFLLIVVPDFKTSRLCMTYLAAKSTFGYIFLFTFIGDVTSFITFEAELFMTIERIMVILTTQDAIQPASLVWTFSCHMPKLFTISAFDRRV